MNVFFKVILMMALSLFGGSRGEGEAWARSSKLESWYSPLDICLLADQRKTTVDVMVKDCTERLPKDTPTLPPVRCRVGNTWPARSAYCDPEDIPFPLREHLFSSVIGLDDPSVHALKDFFRILAKRQGMLLMVGDSVTQQFYSAVACELEREGVWTDPGQFTNTDETKTVTFGVNETAVMRFLPVYHLVNGRYDRVANAALHQLKNALAHSLNMHRTVFVLINMGLHYVDNPVAGFTKQDYTSQMTTVLQLLHNTVIEHPSHTIKILWRETTAQHFPTPNGYWPGVKFSQDMQLKCVKIEDTSPAADWRNRAVEQIILHNNLFNVQILRFYNTTLPLWAAHPNGQLRDCTHFCWFPMLFQPLFHQLRRAALALPSS